MAEAKMQLAHIMESITTDGVFGREMLQLVMRLPIGLNPVFDRYRASVALDHGHWDDLRLCLASNTIEQAEVTGVRDIVLAPVETTTIPAAVGKHQQILFEVFEFRLRRADVEFRRWSRRVAKFNPDILWKREDVAAGRHMRYRRLHDAVVLAQGESCAGRLPLAIAFAQQAQRLGDEGEPLRDVAHDLELLCRAASGEDVELELWLFERTAKPTRFSPLGAWENVHHLMPLLGAMGHEMVAEAASLSGSLSSRFGSPRGEFQPDGWLLPAP